MALWQEGVTTIFMSNNHGTHLFDETSRQRFDTFIKMSGIKIKYVEPNLSWLKQLVGVL
jgi:hypothetical protein